MLNLVDAFVRTFLENKGGRNHSTGDLSGGCCFDSLGEKLLELITSGGYQVVGPERNTERSARAGERTTSW